MVDFDVCVTVQKFEQKNLHVNIYSGFIHHPPEWKQLACSSTFVVPVYKIVMTDTWNSMALSQMYHVQ